MEYVIVGAVLAGFAALEVGRRAGAPGRPPLQDDADPFSARSRRDVLIVVLAVLGVLIGVLGVAGAKMLG